MYENKNTKKEKLLNAILNAGDGKINSKAVEMARKGDVSGLTASLDEESRKKLSAALSNKEKAKEILSSKEAKEIIKKFLGGKANG